MPSSKHTRSVHVRGYAVLKSLVLPSPPCRGEGEEARARRDVQPLLTMLIRFVLDETRRWNAVRVPPPEDEVRRPPHREVRALKEERPQHMHRMQGLLAGL